MNVWNTNPERDLPVKNFIMDASTPVYDILIDKENLKLYSYGT
jgi:hypothetical protein